MTWVVTDVEGSTLLWEWAPDVMSKAIELHNAVRACCCACTGLPVRGWLGWAIVPPLYCCHTCHAFWGQHSRPGQKRCKAHGSGQCAVQTAEHSLQLCTLAD